MDEQLNTLQQQLNEVAQEFQNYKLASRSEIGNLRNAILQSELAYNRLHDEVKTQGENVPLTPSRPSVPRLSPPSRYAGGYKVDVSDWLFEVSNFLEATGVSNDQKLPTTIALLTGPAAKWWQNVQSLHQDIGFEAFKQLLVKQFSVVDRERDARDQLFKLKQVRSLRAYSNEFRTLIIQVPDMNEADKVDRYIRGLKDRNVKAQVLLKKPENLESAILVAETLDSVYFSVNSGIFFKEASQKVTDTAMDLDNVHVTDQPPFKRLTPDEKKRIREAGGCVYCRARDHPVDRCPKLVVRNKSQTGNGHRA